MPLDRRAAAAASSPAGRRVRPGPGARSRAGRRRRRAAAAWLAAAALALVAVAACAAPVPGRPSIASSFAARYVIDGAPVVSSAAVSPLAQVRIVFTRPVAAGSVHVTLDGSPVPAAGLAWSADRMSAQVPLTTLTPYQPVTLRVVGAASLRDPGPLKLTVVAAQPANSTTGVGPGFVPRTPLEVVVENSPPARPQAGLQNADVVYEYLSEYSVTRMTAIYFASIPGLVGPVRSCRMINPYLTFAYSGFTLCSGVSAGTAGYMFGDRPGSKLVPSLMDAFDYGHTHFSRSGDREIPHNLYTSSAQIAPIRAQQPQPPGDYTVAAPHPDVHVGQPAPAPSVPLHSAAWTYDPGSQQYLRLDHGTPLTDQDTGAQIHARTVVLMHVPFHDAGWIEDENGGAHSVWYDLIGSGPAEIYSDGLLIHATWHMGTPGEAYPDNHTPPWFTDEAGHLVVFNTGLTWIHVLGDGQERCPDNVADCH